MKFSHIPDKTENGIVDILVIPALSECVDELSDATFSKEATANVLVEKMCKRRSKPRS